MSTPIRRNLARVVAIGGALLLGRMLLSQGPHDVTLALTVPQNTCSSSLSVVVWKGADPLPRPENLVQEKHVVFADGRAHEASVSMHLMSGAYRVRAAYDRATLDGALPLPLDRVIDVTESGTIVLPLDGDGARCP